MVKLCKNCGHPIRKTKDPLAKHFKLNYVHYHKEFGGSFKCLICDCVNPEKEEVVIYE